MTRHEQINSLYKYIRKELKDNTHTILKDTTASPYAINIQLVRQDGKSMQLLHSGNGVQTLAYLQGIRDTLKYLVKP